MKVLFLFMSKGSAQKGSVVGDGWKKKEASPHYQEIHGDECYFQMFASLLASGVISDLKVFFESGVGPGKANFVPGAENYVIPEINMVDEFIDDDTIIFVRGGFKHWHDFLLKYKGKNWLILYAANTGRDKWTWWDIIFDDLLMQNIIDRRGRYQFPFIKPTNENIFIPKKSDLKYDICIGASNIHDKKGQWVTVKTLEVFKRLYGYYPTCVMPGGIRRSEQTNKILQKEWVLNEIEFPGILTKAKLSNLFASCKVFMHLGTGGQNDRSILEAHACGIPVVLSNTSRFTPLLKEDNDSTYIFDPKQSYEQWATRLFDIISKADPTKKSHRAEVYKKRMGYHEVVIPQLTKFFNILKGTSPNNSTKEKLIKTFLSLKEK